MALPTRIKLTLPFALAMAVVLAALGVFVYLRIGSTLLASIDQGLRGYLSMRSLSSETATRSRAPASLR